MLLKRIIRNAYFTALTVAGLVVIQDYGHPLSDEPKDPTFVERTHFQRNLTRLQGHSKDLPRTVDEVIRSLSDTLRLAFDCPAGAKVDGVTIKVSTRHIRWERRITVDQTGIEVPANAVGYYIWHPRIRIANRRKDIVADSFVMLDAVGPLWPGKSSILGPISDESIIYHELLHGQLLIEAMYEKAWRKQVCDCEFDYGPQDAGHQLIPDLVYAHLKNLADLYERVFVVDIPPQSEEGSDGSFEVAILDVSVLGKNGNWEVMSLYPDRSNVDRESFHVRLKGKKLVAVGRLIEEHKTGYALVHLAPKR